MSDDGTCTAEIKSRIAMAKNAFNKRRELKNNEQRSEKGYKEYGLERRVVRI